MNDADLIARLGALPPAEIPDPAALIEAALAERERTARPRWEASLAAAWLVALPAVAGLRLMRPAAGPGERLQDVVETLGRPIGTGLVRFFEE